MGKECLPCYQGVRVESDKIMTLGLYVSAKIMALGLYVSAKRLTLGLHPPKVQKIDLRVVSIIY